MNWILISLSIFISLISTPVLSAKIVAPPEFSCDTTFTDGATSHSSTGSINFVNNTYLYQGSDSVLESPTVNNNGWGYSCWDGGTACSASGSATTKINLPTFQTTSNPATLTVENGFPQTIGNSGDNEFASITLNSGGELTTSNAQSTYKITNLISNRGTLRLSPGEYWVENLSIATGTLIYLNEPGEVKFYVKNDVTVGSFSEFNKAAASDYKLIFVGYSDISVGVATRIYALIYAQGDIVLQSNAHVVGATSASNVSFETSSRVNYQCSSIAPTVDHYQIIHDGNGLCDAENITIKACTSSIGDTCVESTENISLDFIVTGISTPPSGHVVTKSVTFTGHTDDGFGFNYTIPEQVTLSIANETIGATNGFICNDNSRGSCNMLFADAGFKISGFNDIEISGVPNDAVTIQAVQTNTNTGVCDPLFDNNKVLDVEFAIQAITPSTTGGLAYKMGTLAGHIDIDKNIGVPTNYKDVSLTFGALSTATLPENVYLDAGIISLHARYVIAATAENPEEVIYGDSGSFTVRPNAFRITTKNSDDELLNGNTSSASITQKAGLGFDLLFEAINADWYGDGNPDKTVNYTGIDVDVALQRIAPNPGSEGLLIDGTGLSLSSASTIDYLDVIPFSSGQYQSNSKAAKFSEVGVYQLHLMEKDTNSPDNTTGNNKAQGSQDLGRFIPSHFIVTSVDDGTLTGTCSAADTTDIPFVYSGQMLSDNLTTGALGYWSLDIPSIVIEARNADDILTQNYIDDFFKLSLTNFNRLTLPSSTTLAPDSDASQKGKDTTNLVRLIASLNTASLVDNSGEITYSYGNNDHFVYIREDNSEINEFTADIDLSMVSIIDTDLVETQDYDDDAGNSLILTLNPAGKVIRFGRAQLENSYGPETSNLPQPLSVNYFEDDQYKVADTDPCTPYNATNINLSNISLNPALTPVIAADGKFIDEIPEGITRAIELTAPNAGNMGQVCVTYNIVPWLQYNWATDAANLQCAYMAADVDGLFNDNPFSIATFGLFRGNDRIIYQREIEK